jgi:hypothetical protein
MGQQTAQEVLDNFNSTEIEGKAQSGGKREGPAHELLEGIMSHYKHKGQGELV